MQRALDIIPRASYEIVAYLIPGALALFGIHIALLTTWDIDGFSGVKDAVAHSEGYSALVLVLLSYATGRLLCAMADWTVKPLVKHCCGDPDKYLLLHNKAVLKEWVKDYTPHFKESLQSRVSSMFGIAPEHLADVPYFKLCVEWIELHFPHQAMLLKQRHTIEIFARNMTMTSLVVAGIFLGAPNALATIVGLIAGIVFVYYYYARQVIRARSVYETFFASTASMPPAGSSQGSESLRANLQRES